MTDFPEFDDGVPEGVDEAAEPVEPVYSDAITFFTEQLAPQYLRVVDTPNRAWCPRWWAHPEALARVDAMWRAWETLRLDGAFGMSVWFRDHVDHHMGVLLDREGPFRRCSVKGGHREHVWSALPVLPTEPPRADLASDATGVPPVAADTTGPDWPALREILDNDAP